MRLHPRRALLGLYARSVHPSSDLCNDDDVKPLDQELDHGLVSPPQVAGVWWQGPAVRGAAAAAEKGGPLYRSLEDLLESGGEEHGLVGDEKARRGCCCQAIDSKKSASTVASR